MVGKTSVNFSGLSYFCSAAEVQRVVFVFVLGSVVSTSPRLGSHDQLSGGDDAQVGFQG